MFPTQNLRAVLLKSPIASADLKIAHCYRSMNLFPNNPYKMLLTFDDLCSLCVCIVTEISSAITRRCSFHEELRKL